MLWTCLISHETTCSWRLMPWTCPMSHKKLLFMSAPQARIEPPANCSSCRCAHDHDDSCHHWHLLPLNTLYSGCIHFFVKILIKLALLRYPHWVDVVSAVLSTLLGCHLNYQPVNLSAVLCSQFLLPVDRTQGGSAGGWQLDFLRHRSQWR